MHGFNHEVYKDTQSLPVVCETKDIDRHDL